MVTYNKLEYSEFYTYACDRRYFLFRHLMVTRNQQPISTVMQHRLIFTSTTATLPSVCTHLTDVNESFFKWISTTEAEKFSNNRTSGYILNPLK